MFQIKLNIGQVNLENKLLSHPRQKASMRRLPSKMRVIVQRIVDICSNSAMINEPVCHQIF